MPSSMPAQRQSHLECSLTALGLLRFHEAKVPLGVVSRGNAALVTSTETLGLAVPVLLHAAQGLGPVCLDSSVSARKEKLFNIFEHTQKGMCVFCKLFRYSDTYTESSKRTRYLDKSFLGNVTY